MTPVEKMKSLLEGNSTGWRFQDQTGDGSASSEVKFLNALIGLAPHLMLLWEELDKQYDSHGFAFDPDPIKGRLECLNDIAMEILK